MPAPTIGLPLPRATEAYSEPEKWDQWILAEHGHGPEWARVFRLGPTDVDRIWRAIADAVLDAPISSVREADFGTSCEVYIVLTVDVRISRVRSAWHYANEEAAPRLVTAFPTP
jgi:hypothetical protein